MQLDSSPDPELQVQHELHLRKAEKVRANLNSTKDTAYTADMCFTFDLQKTLLTPSISTGAAYCKRQIGHTWHEQQWRCHAHVAWSRSGSEIGSCIWKFAYDWVEEGAKTFTGFCDSCGGQNRNPDEPLCRLLPLSHLLFTTCSPVNNTCPMTWALV